jgi:hypothetical protein
MFKLSVSAKLTRALAVCAVFAASLVAFDASAQTDDERAGARAAAQEGATAFREKRWADAIDLFTRAESLVHSPMHVIFMARAHANLNKLVKARELYNKVIREPLGSNAPKAFQNAQEEAQKELNELEPRLPYVTVQVDGAGAQAVSVTQDGVAIPPALIGVPRPVDPGEHEFQALTETLASRPQKITVAEKGRQTITLKLEPRSAVAAPPVTGPPPTATPEATGPATAPIATPGVPGGDQPAPADSGSGGNGLLIGGIAAGAIGVAGVVAGIIFMGKASDKDEEADKAFAKCSLPGNRDMRGVCLPRIQNEVNALDDDAKSARTLGTVGFVVGGIGIAGGATLLVLHFTGKSKSTGERPHVEPWVGVGSAGLRGTF